MSIEQAIHARWQADAALEALLPAARLVTGIAHDAPRMPYAVLAQTESKPVVRASSGTIITRTALRLSIWAADLDAGQAIAREADRVLNRTSFALAAGTVLNLQRVHSIEQAQAEGAWLLALDYVATHEN